MNNVVPILILVGSILELVRCNSTIVGLLQSRVSNVKSFVPDELSLQKLFPVLNSNCVKESIKDYMSICLNQGLEQIPSNLKVVTAIRLSLCEFEHSSLDNIPKSCDFDIEDNRFHECIIEMESHPQWWTSYSGNYQRLNTLCYEQSLPYEKEQMLQVFLNVTSLFASMNEDLEEKVRRTAETTNEMATKLNRDISIQFNKLQNVFSDITKELEDTDVQNQIGLLKKVNLEQWQDINNFASKTLKMYLESQNVFKKDVEFVFLELLNEIQQRSEETTEMAVNYTMEKWENKTNETLSTLMGSLDEVHNNIRDVRAELWTFKIEFANTLAHLNFLFSFFNRLLNLGLNKIIWISPILIYLMRKMIFQMFNSCSTKSVAKIVRWHILIIIMSYFGYKLPSIAVKHLYD